MPAPPPEPADGAPPVAGAVAPAGIPPRWRPDPVAAARTQLAEFSQWLVHAGRAPAAVASGYPALHAWSVDRPGDFWLAVADFFGVQWAQRPTGTLVDAAMPGAQWFPGGRLNIVTQLLRPGHDREAAIVLASESGERRTVSYADLRRQVAAVAGRLRDLGVVAGDRVAAYLPNCVEGVVAFLATASLGAVWAQTGLDYGAPAAAERMAQLEPTVLVAGSGYRFGGRVHDRRGEVEALRRLLPGLRHTIWVSTGGVPAGEVPAGDAPAGGMAAADPTMDATDPAVGATNSIAAELSSADSTSSWQEALTARPLPAPEPVDFDHPLWVLFTSGTTGRPKGLVHGHGGVLLEQLVSTGLHMDVRAGDVFFWYTSPNWMMWNSQVFGLAHGATIVLFDGRPTTPAVDALWRLVAELRVAVFGTSPGYLEASEKAGLEPGRDLDLSRLRLVGVTGSVLPASANAWFREHVSRVVQLGSMSGGTDVVGVFLASAPTLPVYDGEISAPALGAAVQVWDEDGTPLPPGEPGELVVTVPMPSMPLALWDDPDGSRLRAAYHSTFPGVWRHGDLVVATERGSLVILGRSDATINRHGVRIGSAEIYEVLAGLPEVADALVVGVEQADGGYWLPLFVVPAADAGPDLPDRIRQAIATQASPRHVPDDVIVLQVLPHTRTGKRLEVPIKRILQGADPERVLNRGAVDVPEALDVLADIARTRGPQ